MKTNKWKKNNLEKLVLELFIFKFKGPLLWRGQLDACQSSPWLEGSMFVVLFLFIDRLFHSPTLVELLKFSWMKSKDSWIHKFVPKIPRLEAVFHLVYQCKAVEDVWFTILCLSVPALLQTHGVFFPWGSFAAQHIIGLFDEKLLLLKKEWTSPHRLQSHYTAWL